MFIAPGQAHTAPQGTKFWCQQKLLVTSVICCQFQIINDNSFWKIYCFTFFPYKSIRDLIWPCRKICQGQPRVIIWANWQYSSTRWCIQRFKVIGLLALEKKISLGFYHIWPWWPSWSCDQDHLSKLSFPHSIVAPYEIWLWLVQCFLRRRCLKSVDDDVWQTDLSYKLTGSGELKWKKKTARQHLGFLSQNILGPSQGIYKIWRLAVIQGEVSMMEIFTGEREKWISNGNLKTDCHRSQDFYDGNFYWKERKMVK